MFICSFWNCNPPVTAFPLHIEGKRAQPTRGTSKNPICAYLPVFLFNFSSVIKGISYHSTHHKTAVECSLSPCSLTLWRLRFGGCTELVSPEQHKCCGLNAERRFKAVQAGRSIPLSVKGTHLPCCNAVNVEVIDKCCENHLMQSAKVLTLTRLS